MSWFYDHPLTDVLLLTLTSCTSTVSSLFLKVNTVFFQETPQYFLKMDLHLLRSFNTDCPVQRNISYKHQTRLTFITNLAII